MTKTRSILPLLALVSLLLTGCGSASDSSTGHLAQGVAYTSGSSDDGHYFYQTTVTASGGTVQIQSVKWSGTDGSPTAINISPGELSNGAAYQVADNQSSLPFELSSTGQDTAVVTLLFEQADIPSGTLQVTTNAASEFEIVPTWD